MFDQIGLVILAAGASSRLGQSKQLLPYRGLPLLRYVAQIALASRCRPVVVVLGAQAAPHRLVLTDLPVEMVENSAWSTGMGSSIRRGVQHLNYLKAVILTVCDQPLVTSQLFDQLCTTFLTTRSSIVACTYGKTVGTPALFAQQLFPQLEALSGPEGAKSLLNLYPTVTVPFALGAWDIDTLEDYQRVLAMAGMDYQDKESRD